MPVSPYVNLARAAVGQGLGMGWGDEGEAWLRSKLGDEDYQAALKKIRQDYGQYSAENPWTAGAAELAGGVLPGVVAMLVPGGQIAGATQLSRAGLGSLARLGGLGALTGAVSGAGAAPDESRVAGATSGALLGGALGVTLPSAIRAGSSGTSWLRDRLASAPQRVEERAAAKLAAALDRGKMTPVQLEQVFRADRPSMLPSTGTPPPDIPSVLANASPALTARAKAVIRRPGEGSLLLEDALNTQRAGTKARVAAQVKQGLKAGDYYDDLQALQDEMKTRAGPLYQQAFAHGEVTDPAVLAFLDRDVFKKGMAAANESLNTRGIKTDFSKATVENLDHVKQGLDRLIEAETDPVTQRMTGRGRDISLAKKDFLAELDRVVPDYELARGVYAGGAELRSAMNKGLNTWATTPPELVEKAVASMNPGELAAYRTGVARKLYGAITEPSGNANSAHKIIGSLDTQKKLAPLFDNPGEFALFKAAMEREAQLFQQSGKALGGSDTAGNLAEAAADLAEDHAIPTAIHRGMLWGWGNGVASLVSSAINKGGMSEKFSNKLAQMLSSSDPHEVAAVVKLLEEQTAKQAPKELRRAAIEGGAVTGATSGLWPAPAGPDTSTSVKDVLSQESPNELAQMLKAEEEAAKKP